MRIRRNTGSMARLAAGLQFTAQAARRMMIALTVLGVLTLSAGIGFTLAQRASAAPYDVCPSTCAYSSIQDAINAAAPGDTITVGPGTYTPSSPYTTLLINKSLTLRGPNAGKAGVSAARGPEASIDANGNAIAVTIAATNVTLNGFEVTGSAGSSSKIMSAGITGSSADGALIENNVIKDNWNGLFELDGNTLTITRNLIRDNSSKPHGVTCFSHSPYCNGIFIGGSDSSIVITHNTIDETYTNASDIINNFQRALSISPAAQANATIQYNTLVNSSTLGNLTGTFTHNVELGGTFAVRLIGGDSNFSVSNNTFTGLFSSAVVTQQAYMSTGNANLKVNDNTVNQDIGDLFEGQVYNNEPVVATFDFDALSGKNNFTGNTVTYTGAYNGLGITSVEAVHLRSGVSGSLYIGYNTFNGGGVGGAANSGIALDAEANPPSVIHNIIRAFTYGVNDSSNASYTLGKNNCISGNSVYGFSADTGTHVNAQGNWWGSALGPGTGVGYGNPVTMPQVTVTPFLTTPPMVGCAGPITTNVQTNVNPLPVNTSYTLTATLDTTTTSNAPVAAAYYTLDGGAPQAMTTTSGTFGSSVHVDVTSASLTGFASTGTHQLCVFGTDTYGQAGDASCMTLTVIIPTVNTTTTVTSSVNPSVYNQSVTFTITVVSGSGTPTGDVTLKEGATTLAGPLTLNGSGVATFTTSALVVGTHPLVASYAGDASGNPIFQPSTSATLNQVVNKVDTTTTVTASPNPSVSGQTVTFSVTVHAADGSTPTGSVTLSDGSTQLGVITLVNGAGTLASSALSVGTHNLSAAYSGDTTHNTSNGSASATVTATPPVPTGSSNAYVRIAQSSEAYSTSDIAIDGSVTFPHVAACTVQPYYPITAGKHTFTVAAPSGASTVITQAATLTAGQYYTLAVVGNSAQSITPALLVFEDDNTVATNQAKVRVYHLADTLGPVQVKSGSTVVAANLSFGNATNYTNQAAGSVTYSFQPSSGPALTDTLNVSANQVYSIFLMCRGQVSNAAATGIPNALPQTGYGTPAQWLTPLEVRILLIAGAILLLAGLLGFASYAVIARRRNMAF